MLFKLLCLLHHIRHIGLAICVFGCNSSPTNTVCVVLADLAADLTGVQECLDEEDITSGVSSTNSAGRLCFLRNASLLDLHDDYERLQGENVRCALFVHTRCCCCFRIVTICLEFIIIFMFVSGNLTSSSLHKFTDSIYP